MTEKLNIFEKIKNAKDNKEKQKILENFWLKEKRSDEENIRIIKEGLKILDAGKEREKIISLQVISRAGGFPLSGQLREIAESIGKDNKTKYDVLRTLKVLPSVESPSASAVSIG